MDLSELVAELKSVGFPSKSSPPGNAMFCLAARTLAETEANLLQAKKIEGMRNVKMLLLKEIREFSQWIDSAIDRKISETARPPVAN